MSSVRNESMGYCTRYCFPLRTDHPSFTTLISRHFQTNARRIFRYRVNRIPGKRAWPTNLIVISRYGLYNSGISIFMRLTVDAVTERSDHFQKRSPRNFYYDFYEITSTIRISAYFRRFRPGTLYSVVNETSCFPLFA